MWCSPPRAASRWVTDPTTLALSNAYLHRVGDAPVQRLDVETIDLFQARVWNVASAERAASYLAYRRGAHEGPRAAILEQPLYSGAQPPFVLSPLPTARGIATGLDGVMAIKQGRGKVRLPEAYFDAFFASDAELRARQLQAPGSADEHVAADALFELLDGQAEGLLGEVQPFGGPGEAALLGQGDGARLGVLSPRTVTRAIEGGGGERAGRWTADAGTGHRSRSGDRA